MKKVKLYIAQSLDGFIADENGGVEWLEEVPNPEKSDYGYTDFYNCIDTTIMGNSTYKQVIGFDIPFPYSGKDNYVFTNNPSLKDTENVCFISGDHLQFVETIKSKSGKDIWLIGGSKLNTFFLIHRLIDEFWIFTMPVVLGNGIPLFEKNVMFSYLKLTESKSYASGVVMLKYNPV